MTVPLPRERAADGRRRACLPVFLMSGVQQCKPKRDRGNTMHQGTHPRTARALETTRGFMFKLRTALLITALACSSSAMAQPVRNFDDPGAPPFKVLKE